MLEVSIHYPIYRRVDVPSNDRVRFELVLPKRPLLVWIKLRKYEQIQFPWGHGIAYYDLERGQYLTALMPLNVIIGALIWVYQWIRIGFAIWCHKHKKETHKQV